MVAGLGSPRAAGKDTRVSPKPKFRPTPPTNRRSGAPEGLAPDDPAGLIPDGPARDEQVVGGATLRPGGVEGDDRDDHEHPLFRCGEVDDLPERRLDDRDAVDLTDLDVGLLGAGDPLGGEGRDQLAVLADDVYGVGGQVDDGGHDGLLSPPKWNGPRSSTALLLSVLSTAFSLKMGFLASRR